MPDSHRSRSKSPGGHSHRSKKSHSKSKSKSSHSRSSSRSSSRSGYAKEFGGSKRQPIVLAYAPPEKPVGGVGRGRGRGRGRGGGGVLVEKKTPGPPGQVKQSKSHGSRSSSRSGSQDGKKKKGEAADSDKKSDKGKGAKKGEKKGGGRGGAGGGQKKDKKEEKDKEEKKKGHGSRSRSGSKSSKSRSSSSSSSSSSDEENSIYKTELKGLKVDLKELHDRAKQQQSSRGHQTHDKGGKEDSDKHLKKLLHHPNVSNDLGPYANTHTVEFLMKKDKTRKYYPATKFTATSLIDPWDEMVDKKPTKRIRKPKHKKSKDSKSSSSSSDDEAKEDKKEEKKEEEQEEKKEEKDEKKDKEDKKAGDVAKKTPRHGPMPILEFDTTGEYWRGPVPFTELPKIIAQIREEYMANGSKKTESDYTRTKEDFHNLELDRIEEVKKSSRRNLTKTYNAYLTNTPGSKKALDECLQEVKTRLGDDWESSSDEEVRKTVREQAKKNMESEKRKQRSSRRSRSNSPHEGGKNRGRGHRDGSADSRGSRGGSGRGRRSRSNTPPGHEGSRKGSPARS